MLTVKTFAIKARPNGSSWRMVLAVCDTLNGNPITFYELDGDANWIVTPAGEVHDYRHVKD